MFVVLLKFAANKDKAAELMDGHNAWLKAGFDDGAFLVAGSLQTNQGGAILAQGESLAQIQAWVEEDPFVAQGVVNAEILEITPKKTDQRLQFLID